MSPAPTPDAAPTRWVVLELDARGEIDDHAAMCLRHVVAGALVMGALRIVVDLRDLCAVDARVVTLLEQLHADCEANATTLRLLVCERTDDDTIAGLCDPARRHGEPRTADRALRPVGVATRSRRVRPA
jgi:anti-anti-sigma regulatory factor